MRLDHLLSKETLNRLIRFHPYERLIDRKINGEVNQRVSFWPIPTIYLIGARRSVNNIFSGAILNQGL